jgi:hypothetical protein
VSTTRENGAKAIIHDPVGIINGFSSEHANRRNGTHVFRYARSYPSCHLCHFFGAVSANGVMVLVVDLLLDWERQAVCGSMNARFSFGRCRDRHGRQTRSMEWSVQVVLMLGGEGVLGRIGRYGCSLLGLTTTAVFRRYEDAYHSALVRAAC